MPSHTFNNCSSKGHSQVVLWLQQQQQQLLLQSRVGWQLSRHQQ
jgi:hypothetical protein